jgi:hypothetical protein
MTIQTSSSKYPQGLAILRTLFRYTNSTAGFDKFLDALKRNWDGTYIPDADFVGYVEGLADTKKLFLTIPFKDSSDFDDILKKIGSVTPKGKFPDRRTITSAFLDPKNFKASFIDIVSLTATATKDVVKSTAQVAAGVGSIVLIAKLVGAGMAAYLIVKSFGQKKGYLK